MVGDGWATDTRSGFAFPAHAAALREGGAAFLTRAFHASGVLEASACVSRISALTRCGGGSTGAKLVLDVEYTPAQPQLTRALFVKFSRDFDDPLRDQARGQMAQEVRFAQLSRQPAFPIAVPACYFAGWHAGSGTGVLITERIAFGENGIASQHAKSRDDEVPDVVGHYRAILAALARLAARYRADTLSPSLAADFPFSFEAESAQTRALYSAAQLTARVTRYAEFVSAYPALLPERLRRADLIARLQRDVLVLAAAMPDIEAELCADTAAIGLCHWNANIDNAWFWRDTDGALHCGLLDWGCVSQMHVAMAIWGALSAADATLWDAHLDALLAHFITEFQAGGGAPLDAARLREQLLLVVARMTLRWLLDVPAALRRHGIDLAALSGPRDPRLHELEAPRTQLQMLTTVLHLWEHEDFAAVLMRQQGAGRG